MEFLLLLTSLVFGLALKSVASQNGAVLHPMYRVHDESSVSMRRLMVLLDGETCDADYANKLEDLIQQMHKNKYAFADVADALDKEFKSTMAAKGETKLCIPNSVCDSGTCRPRTMQEILPPPKFDDDASPAQVLGAMWSGNGVPPMYVVHDENTEILHKIMTLPDQSPCDVVYAGKLEDLMTEITENIEALSLKATMLDAQFKATIKENADKMICNPNSVCDSGSCRPRLAGESALSAGEPEEEYDEAEEVDELPKGEGLEWPKRAKKPKKLGGRSFKKKVPMGRSMGGGEAVEEQKEVEEVAKPLEVPKSVPAPPAAPRSAPQEKKAEVPATGGGGGGAKPEATKESNGSPGAKKSTGVLILIMMGIGYMLCYE